MTKEYKTTCIRGSNNEAVNQWSTFQPLPKCPHCGHAMRHWYELSGLNSDGDEIGTWCDSCGEMFEIRIGITYDFQTRKEAKP